MPLTEQELEELRESEARSRIVMETVADAIITIDVDSTILFVNPAAERIFGYAAQELLGADMTMLMPDYLRKLHEAGVRRYVETNEKHISWDGVELPGLHKSGREIELEVSFGEFSLNDKRFFTGIARDVTERARARRRLGAQYEVTRVLAESHNFLEAVPKILQAVCEALGWEVGLLWTLDRTENGLRFAKAWHAADVAEGEFDLMAAQRFFTRGEGLPGSVWAAGKPLWVEDIAADKSFPRSDVAEQIGLHAAFGFPVMMLGETVAVLEFFSREARPPDEALLAMVGHIGSQLGQSVERQRAEDERARLREEIIHIQDAQLAELSSPLIPITREIVVMPLVGAIDSKRARRVIETLLRGLAKERAPIAIIDITGVAVVDTHVANTLMQAAQAARLLGTRVILTGIRAGVARSLVGLGIDLESVSTRKSLQDGIALAYELLREELSL